MHQQKRPDTSRQRTALFIAAVIMASFLLIPLVSADETGLTRGSRFTITVTGTPNTPYYVWLTRTYTMSGEPGDQPPVLVAYQAKIEKDPPGGPYVIGSYQYNNGGGRTIIDDVAPSTASMSNTQYYGLVTTDNNGQAIVAFQTSSNTALRTYSVKVENSQSVAKNNIQVQRGTETVNRGSVGFDTVATTPIPATLPTPVILTIMETAIPVPTTAEPEPSPIPTATPTPRVPVGIGVCIIAVGAGILMGRKTG
ncbi:MAG: hypothetical protein CVV30_11005 [Methanomicrobiales archaeon HGW-Methanomicrobiales-1]|nr:MAG: hypothetical protein CVV30_11005 [Methanomicrobiales archaeon HGW-Methanomicrobiales-1]